MSTPPSRRPQSARSSRSRSAERAAVPEPDQAADSARGAASGTDRTPAIGPDNPLRGRRGGPATG
ncbi:hypothetical protein, partial [Plantactinospora alkalitolerans]|uniref:hypothetical protein n=1 Tax=Plantactinospora alkalitolerans TaxID=2789879 RepID=UPI001E592A3E